MISGRESPSTSRTTMPPRPALLRVLPPRSSVVMRSSSACAAMQANVPRRRMAARFMAGSSLRRDDLHCISGDGGQAHASVEAVVVDEPDRVVAGGGVAPHQIVRAVAVEVAHGGDH